MRTCHRWDKDCNKYVRFPTARSHFTQSSYFSLSLSLSPCIFHTVPTVHTRLFLCGGERAMNILRPANVASERRRCGHQAHGAAEREKIKLVGSCTQRPRADPEDPSPTQLVLFYGLSLCNFETHNCEKCL